MLQHTILNVALKGASLVPEGRRSHFLISNNFNTVKNAVLKGVFLTSEGHHPLILHPSLITVLFSL